MAMRSPMPAVSRRSRRLLITVVTVLLLVILLSSAVNLYADWLWFQEVSFTQVMSTTLRTRVLLFVLFGGVSAAVIAANLVIAFALRPSYRPMSLEQQNLERYRLAITPRFRLLTIVVSGFVGLITGLAAQGQWRTWLLFMNSTPFGKVDPQFGRDISFYIFEYPFWRYLISVAFTIIVLSVLAATFVHYLYGGVRMQGSGGRLGTAVIGHLSVLLGLFVALKALAYYFDRFGLLLGSSDVSKVNGASAVDVEWLLPAKNILLWIAALCALVFFVNVGLKRVLLPGMALVLLLVSAVVVGGAVPAFAEQFTIKPNADVKEAKYIDRNIKATRAAYGLTDIQRVPYEATQSATRQEIEQENETVPNIRLLDPSVLSETYTQLQQVRNFYAFNQQLDVDRYTVDGKMQDYVVGVRELNIDELQGNQTNWLNRHTVYTHGNGFVAAPANQVDAAGNPIFVSGFLGDQTNGSTSSEVRAMIAKFGSAVPVKQPRIYYGELIGDYSIVGKNGGNDREFDRPANGGNDQDQQVSTTYTGKGGVSVGSLSRQLLYSIYFKEKNFLLSNALNKNSKILYVRDPRQRVERVAPFLTADGDPYPAVVNGRVVWIIDGFTTSTYYPYAQRQTLGDVAADSLTGRGTVAQPKDDINYIRNSVKATVDAYDGTVKLYAFDEADPVLKTWNKAFGGHLILPKKDIPEELAAHFRYPEDLFKVQRTVLTKYHVSNPLEFFRNNDFWRVPDDPTKPNSGRPQPPYFVLSKFPQESSQRFQLITAVTTNQRDNLTALITASYDESGAPKQLVYELPDSASVLGPNQVQPKMQNDDAVRRDISLFNSSESQVVYGNLLTLPVAHGLLYVEPLYLKSASGTQYPQLEKVLLSFGDKVGYANNLNDALNDLFGSSGSSPPADNPPPADGGTGTPPSTGSSPQLAAAVQAIQSALQDLKTAQQQGDFAAIGKAQQDLDTAVKQFESAR
ncbi:MAG: integral rane protein [Actinomycetia bacterium]|nr:integral rane protein [Actinomycetes bacterium]